MLADALDALDADKSIIAGKGGLTDIPNVEKKIHHRQGSSIPINWKRGKF